MEEEAKKPFKLESAKIGATPTLNLWSQVYNAGNLFAVVSITRNEENNDNLMLPSLGKELLETLEKEFFTLEKKDLASIKEAIQKTLEKVPSPIKCTLIASFITHSQTNNVLYAFLTGTGRIVIKRKGKIGIILDSKSEDSINILSASGFLENNDLIVLETGKFSQFISNDKFLSLEKPEEIAENISPLIHEKQEGDASAAVILYHENLQNETYDNTSIEYEEPTEVINEKKPENKRGLSLSSFSPTFKLPSLNFFKTPNISHTKKMFLTIFLTLILVFVISIYFTINKKENEKNSLIFQKAINTAQQKYDEGQNLLALNKNLAREDFLLAQKTLTDVQSNFNKDSTEGAKIAELLTKLNQALGQSEGLNTVQPVKVDKKLSTLLSYQIQKNSSSLFSQDNDYIYSLSEEEVIRIDKKDLNKEKTIIKNDSDWENMDFLATYLGNVYILNKNSNQILKYINNDSSYSKSGYFVSNKPDLSKVKSLAIDGSVFLLYEDGTIKKFTKGQEENFKNPSLDKPIDAASSLKTDVDTNNLYILDKINQRIVVINKEGVLQAQYQSPIFKDVKDFEVVEKDKTVYILVSNNVYKFNLH